MARVSRLRRSLSVVAGASLLLPLAGVPARADDGGEIVAPPFSWSRSTTYPCTAALDIAVNSCLPAANADVDGQLGASVTVVSPVDGLLPGTGESQAEASVTLEHTVGDAASVIYRFEYEVAQAQATSSGPLPSSQTTRLASALLSVYVYEVGSSTAYAYQHQLAADFDDEPPAAGSLEGGVTLRPTIASTISGVVRVTLRLSAFGRVHGPGKASAGAAVTVTRLTAEVIPA